MIEHFGEMEAEETDYSLDDAEVGEEKMGGDVDAIGHELARETVLKGERDAGLHGEMGMKNELPAM
jgi:hypothetical protein